MAFLVGQSCRGVRCCSAGGRNREEMKQPNRGRGASLFFYGILRSQDFLCKAEPASQAPGGLMQRIQLLAVISSSSLGEGSA